MIAFPKAKMEELKSQLALLIQKSPRPVAAFDADGTLWNTDLGEALFHFQIKNKLLPNLPADPWQHYQDLKEKVSHEVAYLWLAQVNADVPLEQVRSWAAGAVRELHPVPIFPEIHELITWLQQNRCQVYVVTASIKWAVEPGAALLGIPQDHVVGITTKVNTQGLVTSEQDGPITYKKGKVTGLLETTGGQTALFCAGNTEGDLPLLESSTGLRLVVAGSPPDDRNYSTEQTMLKIAAERGWFSHNYLK